jgi:FkbH-like protein
MKEYLQALGHPLDTKVILKKKHAIKKELLQNTNLLSKNIAILGGSTTFEIKNILELFLLDIGIRPIFYESDYNKFYEDAVFENQELEKFSPDVIYVHTTNVNIISYPSYSDGIEEVEKLLQREIKKYNSIWDGLSKHNCSIVQNNFELLEYRILGNLDFYDHRGRVNYIHRLNTLFANAANSRLALYINDINYLSSSLGLSNWYDKNIWYAYKYALSYEAIPHLAKSLASVISSLFGFSKKCLVLDLDNTCWGGVIGDDGLNGIHIGTETAVSEAYTDFQKYALYLKQRGIALAVCSKNDIQNAKEGFSHPDSILKFEDFVAFEANWDVKHANLSKIAKTLNLGMDSFVFVDDNPAERQIVASNLPKVSVPDVGSDVVGFSEYLDKNYYFETVSLLDDDLRRNDFYKNNSQRLEEEQSFDNYGDYLLSLDMRAEIKEFLPIYHDRISQLINKTNQFNLTTKRYTLSEVETVSASDEHIGLYGRLIDRFGDNGLISVVSSSIKDKECHIDLWLMSCRVLKRDMEFAMLDELVNRCWYRGAKKIFGYYYPTAKNAMVADMYANLGFDMISKDDNGNSLWLLAIDGYCQKNKHIKVINE